MVSCCVSGYCPGGCKECIEHFPGSHISGSLHTIGLPWNAVTMIDFPCTETKKVIVRLSPSSDLIKGNRATSRDVREIQFRAQGDGSSKRWDGSAIRQEIQCVISHWKKAVRGTKSARPAGNRFCSSGALELTMM